VTEGTPYPFPPVTSTRSVGGETGLNAMMRLSATVTTASLDLVTTGMLMDSQTALCAGRLVALGELSFNRILTVTSVRARTTRLYLSHRVRVRAHVTHSNWQLTRDACLGEVGQVLEEVCCWAVWPQCSVELHASSEHPGVLISESGRSRNSHITTFCTCVKSCGGEGVA
jgi:hypothetical protein